MLKRMVILLALFSIGVTAALAGSEGPGKK
jgi:hypothetical protein